MSILFLITSAAFFLWATRNTLFWVSLWQTKEYRVDRMFVHLRETEQGKRIYLSILLLLKIVGVFLYGVVAVRSSLQIPYEFLIFLLFATQAFFVFREIFSNSLKRPVPTPKALIIIFLTIWFIFLFYSLPLFTDKFLWLLLIDLTIPFVITCLVLIFSFPTELYRDYIIEKAYKKIELYKKKNKLLVIGITGSYGKSSTKEYISQILENKFTLLKTPETKNTPIGIAMTILSGLKGKVQVFVVEMGAYKKGEIAQICNLVQPQVGVLTAVSNQHLSLFGTIQNTIEAKYELIESLPKNGLALFNGNNENARELFTKTTKKKALYEWVSKQKKNSSKDAAAVKNPEIKAFNIIVGKTWISFDVKLKNDSFSLKAPLLGAHTIENILPAIYIADYLGMNRTEIVKAVSTLQPLAKTMVFHKLINGATIINDTYNISPDSVLAALMYMKIYKGKKILVLEPMIELGGRAKQEHFEIGKQISQVCDYLFLTKKNFYKSIMQGIRAGKGRCEVFVDKPAQIEQFLSTNIEKGDIVVFEGREAGLVFNRLV